LKKVKESKVCVLFVEEDERTRVEVSTRLEVWGYEPELASTMNEALKLVQQRKYGLILLDWYYKDGTGIGLCEAIRSFDIQTPILFYTGVSLEPKLERARKAGAQGFISKPIGKDEFICVDYQHPFTLTCLND
jgi:DNA-binding response OmpR family regulator